MTKHTPQLGKNLIIAIDGPAAAGKSTAGKALASRLGYRYVDTGALYRAAAWLADREGLTAADGAAIGGRLRRAEILLAGEPMNLRVFVDGRDVSEEIRTENISRLSSRLAALPEVRAALLDLQRRLGAGGGSVMDGRDIGTVIFPQADVKFFVSASTAARGRRRWLELRGRGAAADLATVAAEIEERDRRDAARDHAPLRPAADAVRIDTTDLTPKDVVDRMLAVIESHPKKGPGNAGGSKRKGAQNSPQ